MSTEDALSAMAKNKHHTSVHSLRFHFTRKNLQKKNKKSSHLMYADANTHHAYISSVHVHCV